MPKIFKKVIHSKYGIKENEILPYFDMKKIEREDLAEEFLAQNSYQSLFHRNNKSVQKENVGKEI